MRDPELDSMLESFRKIRPDQLKISRWQMAIRKLKKVRSHRFFYPSVAAAMFAGIILGYGVSSMNQPPVTKVNPLTVNSNANIETFINID